MNRVYVPATSVDGWRRLIARPDRHWREGHSAMLVAQSWQAANGFPTPIQQALVRAGEPFGSCDPLLILPEHPVALPGGSRPSQNDVWVLAAHTHGLASITVEAKASEPFGSTLAEWLWEASKGKRERLAFLRQLLGLPDALPGTLRYQLLHRVASALLEAKRFRANVALCLIHSFSDADEGIDDFRAFLRLFQTDARPGEIVALGQWEGIPFHAAWVRHSM